LKASSAREEENIESKLSSAREKESTESSFAREKKIV
jgi:hypothetical protein